MYKIARIKLTLLYFFIIFFIVVLLSTLLFLNQNSQFDRLEIVKDRLKEEQMIQGATKQLNTDLQNITNVINEARIATLTNIFVLDFCLLLISALLSYYLSGKTLEPIANALESQKRFVADASHELRTPLTAIRTEAEVILRDSNSTKLEYKEFTQSTVQEIERLSVLTNQLLSIAKSDNKVEFKKEQIDVHHIVNKVIKIYSKHATKQNVSIELSPSSGAFIYGNTYRIQELFSILIDNAIKYNKPNGSVYINISSINELLMVEIKDTGIGIDQSHLKNVFDRFYRVSQDRNQKGFGLGLPIAKQIVDENGGIIGIESHNDEGTKILITFTKVHQ